jgi:hypothetical protein
MQILGEQTSVFSSAIVSYSKQTVEDMRDENYNDYSVIKA